MKALKLTLAMHLLFFAVWGARLLGAHDKATVVILETSPVDPRDWISGHYVTLRYPIAEFGDCPVGAVVWVRLEEENGYWKRRECLSRKRDDGLWLRGKRVRRSIDYGIERFYVNENSPLRSARSGGVAARVSINGLGSARILELVPR